MPDYQNGVIYVVNVGEQKYVGSTVDFKSRMRQHRWCINHPDRPGCQLKLYNAIRENDGEWQMEIYKEFPCDSKRELLFEEERVRKELGAELNEACCGSGLSYVDYKKQYYQDNREKTIDKGKQYYQDNREKVIERVRKYEEKNREQIRENKRQRYLKNREKMLEKHKERYQENKEKINEQRSQKIECPICGSMIARCNIKQHQRTAKCQRIAEQRAEEVGSS